MRRSRLTERQIVSILKEAEAGATVKEICRRHGISDVTYYNWKSRYGGMSASELKRLKELESELSQYKKMYAELARENYALKELIEKILGPSDRREAARYLVARHGLSKTRACAAVRLSRSSWYRPGRSRESADRDVIEALNAVVEKHLRWGFWMCYDRLRLQGYR